ncbi:MAG: formate--tetrahydrofolate ligase [Thermomicrobium sp.]|nr:formate--tetrahydrofolate ligase [Thermomicrobium sp.]MDW7981834.1 formate--tetrahydrofolate ligase [Thermomicrobium sp.]
MSGTQLRQLRPISEIAAELGLLPEEVEFYGPYKAKVRLHALQRLDSPRARYILVTGINPTPFGEGKTTVSIGLGQAFGRLGLRSVVTVRQSSMGPVFGTKGAGAGGGAAQLHPFPDLALHFTGDNHAVTTAHNLLAALLDNALYQDQQPLDPRRITWPRVLDLNDRALRQVLVGLDDAERTVRASRFDITPASEVMAILALARDYRDLRQRLGRIVVGYSWDGQPVTAEDLGAAGAMAALLVDALKPNLVQTSEGTAAFVHAGPFGNIATGTSSVVADLLATRLADVVITEAGFGTDLGAEKFFHLKCRASGLAPHAAVLVASVRALKVQGGKSVREIELGGEDLDALERGLPNLRKHVENLRAFGVPAVVAINRFPSDSSRELELLAQAALDAGARDVAVVEVYTHGGEGGRALAEAVLRAAQETSSFQPIYELDWPLERKVEAVARTLYGAAQVRFAPSARRQLADLMRLGYDRLPICIAKTPMSLSADPGLLGRPEGFTVEVRELRLFAGAGYVVVLLGDIQTMPGLGRQPRAVAIDIDENGNILGMS